MKAFVIGVFVGLYAAVAIGGAVVIKKTFEEKYNQCMEEKTAITEYCSECMLECKQEPKIILKGEM